MSLIGYTATTPTYPIAKKMAEHRVGCILVMEDDKIKGIFTERDLLNSVVAKGLSPDKTPISQVMVKTVCTIDINETVEAGYQKMQTTKCRHLPIMEHGKVVGMFTMRDILERYADQVDSENQQLKNYIFTTPATS